VTATALGQNASDLVPGSGVAPRPPLLKPLLFLALPVLVEHLLHIGVGLTDTYLANHLVAEDGLSDAALASARATNAASAAAIGSVAYVLWLMGLITGAVGTGATAIIARAVGARHRRLANGVCGQAVTAALMAGTASGVLAWIAAPWLPGTFGLPDDAHSYFHGYIRLLALAIPFIMLMFAAGACLRGAGDTLTPAAAMVVVDILNIVLSIGLTYGKWGLPKLGFDGIAFGTVVSYIVGGLILLVVLLRGSSRLRLYPHRMMPNWLTLKRILRIGVPSGLEGALQWLANFSVVFVVNGMGSVTAAAHLNAIRIESLSYMTGFAFATAAATLCGQSLGMRDPNRAVRATLLSLLVGGGLMTLGGIVFIFFGTHLARWMSGDPENVRMTATALWITGFIQLPFAAAMVFGGALRGAGDTLAVMLYNLASLLLVRLAGVLIVGKVFSLGLSAVWMVLSGELALRGVLMTIRFASGRWKLVKV
jgi:putative MATE family efflux protein